MNKFYLGLGLVGLLGCSVNKGTVNKINVGGQPATLSVDGKKCHLTKKLTEKERNYQKNGEEREFRVEGERVTISYRCGNPENITAAIVRFIDGSTSSIKYVFNPREFLGRDYIIDLIKEAESKLKKKEIDYKSKDFNKIEL